MQSNTPEWQQYQGQLWSSDWMPLAATTLPINAVILQRNGSGQGESTNCGTEQHHSLRKWCVRLNAFLNDD